MNKEIIEAEYDKITVRFKDGILSALNTFIEEQDCEALAYGDGLVELIDMFIAKHKDIDPDILCYEIASSYCSHIGFKQL